MGLSHVTPEAQNKWFAAYENPGETAADWRERGAASAETGVELGMSCRAPDQFEGDWIAAWKERRASMTAAEIYAADRRF